MNAKFPSETVKNTIVVSEYDLSEVDAYLESTICLLSEIKDRDDVRFETFSTEGRRKLLTIFTLAGALDHELDKRMTGDR